MAELPIRPHFKRRGRTSHTIEKANAFNKMAQRIGDYLHTLILEDRAACSTTALPRSGARSG